MQATLDARSYFYPKQKDRSLLYIACAVTVVHLAFMIWAAFTTNEKIILIKPPERLVVKTIDLKPVRQQTQIHAAPPPPAPEPIIESVPEPLPEPIPEPVVKEVAAVVEEPIAEPDIELIPVPEPLVEKPKPKPAEVKKPQPKKETPKQPKKKPEVKKNPPKAKKETPKKPDVKKETPKEKPKEVKKPAAPKKVPDKPKVDTQAEIARVKQRELLAKAQQSIANIDKTRGKIANAKNSDLLTATALPGRIDSLQVDALPNAEPLTPREMGYRDELASRLRLLLKLPEHGEVKVKLTLERSGKVANLVIVNSQSAVNKTYIEKKVPGLSFPAFGNNFEGESQYTFIIALSNEL